MATFYVISISSAGRGMCGASPLAPQDGWAEDQLSPLAKRSPGSFGPPDSSHRRLLTSALTFNPHPVGGTPSASLRGALRLPSLEGAAGPRQPEAVVVRGVSLQLQAVWPDPPPDPSRAPGEKRDAVGARSIIWAMQTIVESALESDWSSVNRHGSGAHSGSAGAPRSSGERSSVAAPGSVSAPPPSPGKDTATLDIGPSRIVLSRIASIEGRRQGYARPLEEIAAGFRG